MGRATTWDGESKELQPASNRQLLALPAVAIVRIPPDVRTPSRRSLGRRLEDAVRARRGDDARFALMQEHNE